MTGNLNNPSSSFASEPIQSSPFIIPEPVPVITLQAKSIVPSILCLVFGALSILVLSILFVPLAWLTGVLGFMKKDKNNFILSGIGMVLSLIGFATSPMLLSFFGALFLR